MSLYLTTALLIILLMICFVLLNESRKNREEVLNKIDRNSKEVAAALGRLQNLESGVNELERVLANVKLRGIFGEAQLESILSEFLNQEQYEKDVTVVPSRRNNVEYAIRLPGKNDEIPVYLPIDSKFPLDVYYKYLDAYEEGNYDRIEIETKKLEQAIKKAASDIKQKYIEPPFTTSFALMFLPFESLYMDVIKEGLFERIQREYSVIIVGPVTIGAFLSSLQTGFKTITIEKKSNEVWKILEGTKVEFSKFEDILGDIQKRLDIVNKEIEQLLGVRTRAIQRKLKDINGEQ